MKSSFLTKLGLILVVLVAFIDGILVANHYHEKASTVQANEGERLEEIIALYESEEEPRIVPFTYQAPDGIWKSPWTNFADEAVLSMIIQWDKQEDYQSRSEARYKLLDIAEFTNKDTPLPEFKNTLLHYYGIDSNIQNPESISEAINGGSVVAVPVNGQTLQSPHYGKPGPRHHMILIHGQTDSKFIVHDPGTKYGESFKFDKQKILESIQDLNGEFRVLIIQP